MQFIIYEEKQYHLFYNFKNLECLFPELWMEKFIKELLEDKQEIVEKEDRLLEQLQLLIEQVMQCFIHYLEKH